MSARAVIYSRFSTDLQNEKSIDDQVSLARQYAAREGLDVVATYSDAAMSGGSLFGRDGLLQLMADAKARQFDVVIVEELDRLSRDMEDLAGIHKRLKHAGIEIRAIHEGVADTIKVGLRGLVGQLYREDLAHKTRRGLCGKVMSGLLASGKAYGYEMDPRNKGLPIILEDESETVRRIYRDFSTGLSARQIAKALNAEGVPGPRGGQWQQSAIHGWEQRGTGILRNPIYIGRVIWNRQRWVKDPDTGKRTSILNDKKDWVTTEVPEYRIVPQDLFDKVQVLLDPRPKAMTELVYRRRPQRLLSGLLKCGGCGGGMSATGKDKSGKNRLCCTRHRDGAACPAPKTFYLETVEDLVVETLERELRDPDVLVEYVKAYNEARQEFAREATRRRSTLDARIRSIDSECERLLRLLTKGIGNEDRIGAELTGKETELKELRDELAQEPPSDVAVLHPAAIKRYEQQLGELKHALASAHEKTAPEIGAVVRNLVHSITLYPDPEKYGGVRLDILGKLRLLCELDTSNPKSGGKMVAGARNDLTPRLPEPLFRLQACA